MPNRIPTSAELDAILSAATRAAAEEAIRIIKARTRAGNDVNGAAFAPYSPEYQERRREAGLDTRVALTATGALLDGLKVIAQPSSTEATIGWDNSHRQVELTKHALRPTAKSVPSSVIAQGLNSKRPFLGIVRDDERQQVARVFQAAMDRGLAALN